MNLVKCCKCRNKATWYYGPGKNNDDDYYCDNHVHRGCSCNVDYETLIEDTDSKGRLLPCCEYDYDENGFDKERFEDE